MNRLLLVDGHACAYRAFYAIRELRGPDGRATNAIFGFIKMLEKARGLVDPAHVAVVWDGGLDEQRVRELPDYKAQRPEMPDDLETQLDQIVEYLDAAGIKSICLDGVEADDLIATIAREAVSKEWQTIIATNDKDFMQLVSPQVQLLNLGDKKQPVWDVGKVVEKTGVRPDQIVDWLSLIGDGVDNIEGVRGVGSKTATRLLGEFDSIDRMLGQLEEVRPERLRERLTGSRNLMLRNRALVALKTDVPGAPGLNECKLGKPDDGRLGRLFESWGFRSMMQKHAPDPQGSEIQLF